MKKRTVVSKLQSNLKREDLELVVGGIPTITQDAEGHVIVVDGDKPAT